MRIVVSGGGTGGHIYPALAFIKEVKQHHPDVEFLYIGTEKGLEKNIVERENIPFKAIEITGFKRKLSFENVKTVMRFLKGVRECKKELKRFKPDAVIGTGGYVCGPVVYAASKLGIPTIIHEQNSLPGLTNKFLSKYVDKVAICFEEAKAHFPAEKVVFTGNPRASEVVSIKGARSLTSFGLQEDKKTVLIFGGSRGAAPINKAVVEMQRELKTRDYQVLYVTGEVHYDKVIEELKKVGAAENMSVQPFLHQMPEYLQALDVIVARAGATTIAEITALGIPSVLIPSPYVTANHQEVNAKSLGDRNAAVVLKESELNGERLIQAIDHILQDGNTLIEMSERTKSLGVPDAAQRLYEVLKELKQQAK
ncbi:undecaprenyldiphospho-muramoylpentapeptide beta-N-acetylglucosaminyltransferase [Bacillus sonorensis]|uniref:undecaprenyldiphospho-muramoylpentapeptide beta-N-acetylglucosaminyltransferase n=1 Tax=Bacillus sonorensis TaxID=119858 RepID=UPI00227EB82E|nr:undecaprenyldiphospho-muramoylpentapeptide beta-N-acetylglucosaminyltransferase [Bacillus sonorensis]MCY7855338.1 undecaprenyldiphospho-muramoylpentapeptide beta-N-acetylglucosaminyltransferase [Bacillus sonorensis]MCZ0069207.1 undecaprenyldiphospho-muramoylpentapeptide beta-N-acetylglucosaminyltransferase [Bacillus sonorensis]MCZ0096595.1 undecaprenyldiphospho-muramoylpentapeptide beta-N-acetylglucosaminyltransferase [Bacillus sonorensis]MEC1502025.1 undecaprenyldiphospho-muramoylpentapepti